MAEFVTERVAVTIDANDRIRVQTRTRCADCRAVVASKAERDTHRCPETKP